MEEQTETEEQGAADAAGFKLEAMRGYLRTARNGLKTRRRLIVLLALCGFALTGVVLRYFPRTYACVTSLVAVENGVLDSNTGGRPLAAAQSLLMRHENLEQVIKDTRLLETFPVRRPALLKVKDRIVLALFGPMDRKTKMQVMVATLETRVTVAVKESVLEISVEWSDADTAAELAEAIKDQFLRLRHDTEISAFQEKIEILDAHSAQSREEIGTLAEQMKAVLGSRADEALRGGAAAQPGAPAPRRTTVVRTTRAKTGEPNELAVDAKKKLTEARQRLAAAEGARAAKIAGEQAKLDELKLKFTPSHPQVITQQERLDIASDVPSELAVMRSDVADLEAQVKQVEGNSATQGTKSVAAVTSEARAAAGTVPLPADVLKLLEREDVDPALGAQMSSAVLRYSSLMNDVRGSKLALDTAQAAFKRRYQIVVPVEVPQDPIRPKPALIIGLGIFVSLLLSLLVPILLELRKGVLIERWQIEMLQLPILGELQLPAKKS